MESLSRPPHRRKHSTTTNASSSSSYSPFSFRSPYDNVLVSKGGKAKFEAHEYAEIFSGSSSIPVLDLSALNERVGSGDCRSSRLDYSNIFGGFRGDDVALPYEQLFNGDVTKTKTRIPAGVESPLHEPGSVNSSAKTKRSSGASNQSIDGIKQQFNVSFNKTSQRNSNESNGKTHIAQLHAVPGFTHFVDETPLQNIERDRPKPSMKREVSRTWSFSSGIEPITIKGGIAPEKLHAPDKSCNVTAINPKSHTSRGVPPSSHPYSPNDSKDLRQSRLPSFASKDASRKSGGEYSPPLLDEELDGNSAAAVSVATLRKAIEQAQESIRIAKIIMEKRKDGLKDGSKSRSKSRLKVKDKKETRSHQVPDASKQKNERETHGKLDPTFPIFPRNDSLFNAGKAKVGMVRENVEVANGHAVTDVGKKFTPSCIQRELLKTDEKVEVENVRHGGPAEAHGETTNFTGLEADAKCRTVTFESGNVDTCSEQMETGKETLEQRELTVHRPKWPEAVSEMLESDPNTSQSVKEPEKSVPEAFIQCQATSDHTRPKSIAEQWERVLSCSEIIREEEKIMHEGGGNLRISRKDELTGENCSVGDDKEKCEKKFVGRGELDCTEQLTVLKPEFDKLQNESQSLAEKNAMEQAAMDKKPDNVVEWKENERDGKSSDGEENETVLEEEHQWFESELQLTEPVKEEVGQMEPEIYQEGGPGIKVKVVHEPEIVDTKLNHEHEEQEQNKIADRHMDSSECEAAETIQMETDNCSEVLNVEEINYAHRRGAGGSEENLDKFEFEEAISGNDIDEAVDAHRTISDAIFSDGQRDKTTAIFSERQEPSDIELINKVLDYQADGGGFKKIDRPVTETCLAVEDNEAGIPIHLELNEMPRTNGLHRCASEEKFFESQPNSTFEGLSSDRKSENVDLMDADHEETMFETASEIHNAAQDYSSKTKMQYLPEFHNIDNKATELFDDKNAKPVLERTSESDEESLLTSILENTDEVSSHKSQACSENLKDNASNKEEGKERLVMAADERDYVGEQSESLHSKDQSGDLSSQSNCEPKEMNNSMEAEREVETGKDMEKNKANPSRASIMGPKDAKGNDQKSEANDHQQRIEAIKRGREREKDRMAVERAIREARERAFAEARQRAMAEAREKLEKASVENKNPVDKVSNESKLRAERAAVERATAEARERALEKAMSQKTYTEARTQAEKFSTERLSSSSRNNGLKHSFSSSDLEKFDGAASESAQRRKARLERHQRIMERAAKALAEKNTRDLLAQKEQAEKNRLAESLDADIKRWARGKEGNLRALLSTLQYILGPNSGWQPVSLTDIITTAAVKKAYRKATLCVHPDKLQQRGATIQQKYICEKVFDLLKAARNRFNSEER